MSLFNECRFPESAMWAQIGLSNRCPDLVVQGTMSGSHRVEALRVYDTPAGTAGEHQVSSNQFYQSDQSSMTILKGDGAPRHVR